MKTNSALKKPAFKKWNNWLQGRNLEIILFRGLLVISFIALALAASAQAISSSSQESLLVESGQDGLGSNDGYIAMADNGSYIVVYEKQEASGNGYELDILGGISTISGSWNHLGVINSARNYDQVDPSVAASADGSTFAVAWESQISAASSNKHVYVKVFSDLDGADHSSTGDIRVNTANTENRNFVEIAMDQNGDFVVVWYNGENDDIYFQRYNSAGTAQGSNVKVDDVFQNSTPNPKVAMDSDGNFVITWQDSRTEDTSYGVFAKRYNSSGAAQGSTFLVNDVVSGYQAGGMIDMANTGEFVILWTGSGHFYQKYNSDGSTNGSAVSFSTNATGSPSFRDVAIDEDLNFVIAYADNGDGLYVSRFDWSDNLMGDYTTINGGSLTTYSNIAVDRISTEYFTAVRNTQVTVSPARYSIMSTRHGLCIGETEEISGQVTACPGETSVSYNTPNVSGAVSYTWTLSNTDIATFSINGSGSITTTSSINVDFNAVNTGDVVLSVVANGGASCGSSQVVSDLTISNENIDDPGSISGDATVVENSTEAYSIAAIAGAASYSWSVPADASIDTDNGNEIYVQFGTSSGTVSVSAFDECGNETASSSISVTVQQTDVTPPEALFLNPANNATGVDPSQISFNIRFNELVSVRTRQTLYLRAGGKAGGAQVGTASSTSNIVFGGKAGYQINFTITNPELIANGGTYYIEMPGSVFHDAQNNFFPGTDETSWSFTLNRVPTNLSLSATSIDENNSIAAVVATITGTDADPDQELIYSLVDGTGDTDNSSFGVVGDQLLAQEVFDYETQTSYSIRLQVEDAVGETYQEAFTISINDLNDTPPVLISYTPDNTYNDLAPANITYTINFDGNVDLSGQSSDMLEVFNSSDQRVDFFRANSSQIVVDGPYVILYSSVILNSNESYYVTYPTGFFLSEDRTLAVSGLDQGVWTFTTRANDGNGPTVINRSPANGSDLEDRTAKTFELIFDEPVNIYALSTNYGFYRGSDDGYIYNIGNNAYLSEDRTTITATEPYSLQANTPYYVLLDPTHNDLPTIYDDDGNAFAGFENSSDWAFSTYGPAELISTSPSDDEAGVDPNGIVMLMGNHDIIAGSDGNIYLRDYDTDALVSTITAQSDDVSIDGNTAQLDFGTLETDKHYYVQLLSIFQDQFGQYYPVWGTNKDGLDFYTTDTQGPQVVSFNPADDATDVDINLASISITFDEPIASNRTGGLIEIRRVSDDLAHQSALSTAPDFIDISGNTLTINQFNPFLYETEWYVTIGSGVVEDMSGNEFTISDNTTWTFTTESAPPAVQTLSPALESSNSPALTDFVMTFDKEVAIGSGGSMIIRRSSDGAVAYSYAYSSSSIVVDGSTITFQKSYAALLESETQYYITIHPGLIVDATDPDNQFPGISDQGTWTFTTRANDGNGPNVVTYDPADGETDVEIDGAVITFNMTFDEPVYLGLTDNNIGLYREEGETDFYFYDIGDPGVIGISDDNLTVTTSIPNNYTMVKGKEYYILHDALDHFDRPIIFDSDGNGIPALTDDQAWRFTTYEGLTYESLDPVGGSVNVSRDAVFTVTTNNSIQSASGSIYLKYSSNHQNAAVVAADSEFVTVNGSEIAIDFGTLDAATSYYIYIPNNVFQDIFDQTFSVSGATTWNFTTIDDVPPSLVSLDPADDHLTVATDANLSLTFDKDIDLGAGNITIHDAGDGSIVQQLSNFNGTYMTLDGATVTFNFPNDLPDDTDFYVNISDGYIRQQANSQITWEGISDSETWTFSTRDPFEPVGSSPDLDETDILVGQDITINFTKDAALGTGSISFYNYSNDELITSLDQNDTDRISISGSDVTFDLEVDLPFGTVIYVLIADGFLQSEVNGSNTWSGIDDPDFWNFMTEADVTSPTLSSVSPDGVIETAASVNLYITLNEHIRKGTGDILIKDAADGSTLQTIDVQSAAVTITDEEAAINPPQNLPFATEVYVEMASGVLEDVHGNDFAGISGSDTWTFITEYNAESSPEVIALSPEHESTGVSLDPTLSVTFHEPISKGTGNIEIFRTSDDQSLEVIDIQDAGVAVSGSELTFSPATLPIGTELYVTICDTCIGDEEEGTFPGIAPNEWSFTTLDNEAPYVVSVDPLDDATDVDRNIGTLTLTFNEPVVPITGSLRLRNVLGNGIVQEWDVTTNEITVTDNVVTLNNVNTLVEHANLWVQNFTGGFGSFQDVSGNPLADWNTNDVWNFQAANGVPSSLTISSDNIDENESIGSLVGDFSTSDSDLGDNHVYTLVEGEGDDDNASFSISGNELLSAEIFDAETKTEYSVRVQTDDSYGGTLEEIFVITVNDIDDVAPYVLSVEPADDATDVDREVGTLTITLSETVVPGSGAIRLRNISGNAIVQEWDVTSDDISIDDNVVTLNNVNTLEEHADVWVQNFTSGLGSFHDLAGNPLDDWNTNDVWNFTAANGVPSELELSDNLIDENENIGTEVGTLSTIDSDLGDNHTYTLVAGVGDDDNASFSISGNSLRTAEVFDAEMQSEYSIRVRSEDGFGGSIEMSFGIDVNDLDEEDPYIVSVSPDYDATGVSASTSFTVTFNEDIQGGSSNVLIRDSEMTTVESFTTSDVIFNGAELTFTPSSDLEEKETYEIIVPASFVTDLAGNNHAGIGTNTWFVTIEDATAPSIVALSPVDGAVGQSLDFDLVMTFDEVVQSTGGGTFAMYNYDTEEQIGPNWYFPAGATFDENLVSYDIPIDLPYETRIYFNITGAIEDAAGNAFNITGKDAWDVTTLDNSDPTDISITAADIDENQSAGTYIGAFSVTDPNGEDNHTMSFVAGEGDDDNNSFYLNGFQLRSNEVFDFETKDTYSIRMRATDNYSHFYEEVFTITINDVFEDPGNNDPTDIVLSNLTIAENEVIGTVVGEFSSVDLDEEDSHAYSLVAGSGDDDNGSFGIDGTNLISAESFDFESRSSYSVRVRTTDNDGGFYEESFTISIDDVDERVIQTITFDPIEDKAYGDLAFDLSASASSGLDVSFSIIEGPVTLVGSTITITGAGEVTIAADQAGDDDYFAAEQVTQSFTISKAAQVITFNSLEDKTFGDEAFNLTAASDSELEVSFSIIEGPATLDGATVTIIGAGEVTIAADQEGNDNYLAAEQVTQSFSVSKADQIITIGALANVLTSSADIELDVNVDTELELTIEVEGPATLNGTTLSLTGAVGTVTITVTQAGNDDYNAASESVSFEVSEPAENDQFITFEALEDKTFGDEDFTLTATASSGLDVVFSIVTGPVTLDGNVVTITGTGEVTIAADQGGNEEYNPAEQVTQTFTVNKADQTVSLTIIGDKTFGDSAFELDASASSELAVNFSVVSGPVTIDGNSVTITGAGEVTIAADQPGDENYNAAQQVTRSFTVDKADQTISITSINDKLTTDDPFNVDASTTSGLSLTYAVTGPASILGNTITLDGTAGTVTVTVTQAGDDNHHAAEESASFEVTEPLVEPEDQSITFESIADKVFGDESFALSATATSGLDVVFSVVSGPITIDGNEVTILGAGEAVIAADQPGDESFNAAPQVTQAYTIIKADQSISFEAIADKTFGDQDFELMASASSGLDVTYTAISGSVSIVGNMVTITGAGDVVIGASQAGDNNYNAATQVTQSFVVGKADQTITIEPIENKTTADGSFDVVASTTSGLGLTYMVEGPATIEGATITLDGIEGTVTVTVSQGGDANYNSAEEFVTFEVESILGLEQEVFEVDVYPNPASDWVRIDGSISGELNVLVHDMNGRLALSETLMPGQNLNVRSLDSGIYFLTIADDIRTTTTKLMVTR